MISIEAHRASIGRFSRKVKYSSSLSSTLKKNEFVDVALFILLLTILLVALYGLVLITLYKCYPFIDVILMVVSIYSSLFCMIRNTSDILSTTFEKMARQNELMRAPMPSKEIKDFPLIPCSYLNTFVMDGRCKYLDTSVLDDGYWEGLHNRPEYRKLILSLKKRLEVSLCLICTIIIFSSCVCISMDILSRMKNSYGLHDLELYSVSFLKLSQLLLAGDIESNPGPVNHTKTTKGGRPKKGKKTFNFTKSKTPNITSIVANRFLTQSNLIHLHDIKPWNSMPHLNQTTSQFHPRPELNCKVSVIQANIVNIKVDAIVNAANEKLLGGGGIDEVIHNTAGPELKNKCAKFPLLNSSGTRCYTGDCKVTDTMGCELNCDYVFHTVGPNVLNKDLMNTYEGLLRDCYQNCLLSVLTNNVKSIVFPCISTGIFNFPNRDAAHIALKAARSWLETYHSAIEQIIFCTYDDEDWDIYLQLIPEYFPVSHTTVPATDILEDKDDDQSSHSIISHHNALPVLVNRLKLTI